jgi:hypothetical protein
MSFPTRTYSTNGHTVEITKTACEAVPSQASYKVKVDGQFAGQPGTLKRAKEFAALKIRMIEAAA